jgi:FlaA1/EpsC-like NDP-sugar epimerase
VKGDNLLGRGFFAAALSQLNSGVLWAARLPRPTRKLFAVAMDVWLAVFATWIAWSLRVGYWQLTDEGQRYVILGAILLWLPISFFRGTYASLIRFSGGQTMGGLAITAAIFTVPMAGIFMIVGVPGVPRTIGLLHPIVFFSLLGITRLIIRFILTEALQADQLASPRRPVCIYGAGWAGKQLAVALRHEPGVKLSAFVDDDKRLKGQVIDGVRVYHSADLENLIKDAGLAEVYLAIPSTSKARQRQIIGELTNYPVQVRSLPSIGQLIDGEVKLADLNEIVIEDLLGRDTVPPRQDLLAKTIADKVVMVTGAGGSIGSELARQIVVQRPARLILVEMSELGLYSIERELLEVLSASGIDLEIVPELANVADRDTVSRLMARYRPQTVYHAAAYKHVPLVEANPLAGIRNNILGTLYTAQAARIEGVEKFILVSTDKAVRPTNIMGATKRVCEMILQAFAHQGTDTCFSMVRFGNVLGSSGSVVPLFKQQIANGGPITLTDRRVTRFFMTIPEAAGLVIQAGSMARGGEVFVLDMGDSIEIIDLARRMIHLSGLTVRDDDAPDGDIEIREVGLRSGEKLYEELLIGDSPSPTEHPRVLQARECFLDWEILEPKLSSLAISLGEGNAEAAVAVVKQLVPEHHSPASQPLVVTASSVSGDCIAR